MTQTTGVGAIEDCGMIGEQKATNGTAPELPPERCDDARAVEGAGAEFAAAEPAHRERKVPADSGPCAVSGVADTARRSGVRDHVEGVVAVAEVVTPPATGRKTRTLRRAQDKRVSPTTEGHLQGTRARDLLSAGNHPDDTKVAHSEARGEEIHGLHRFPQISSRKSAGESFRTIDRQATPPKTGGSMARYSAFLGRWVVVQYRAADIVLPASGIFVADSGRSIFLEQHLEQRGRLKHFRWEIPYQYLVRIEEAPEPKETRASPSAQGLSTAPAPSSAVPNAAARVSDATPSMLPLPNRPKTA